MVHCLSSKDRAAHSFTPGLKVNSKEKAFAYRGDETLSPEGESNHQELSISKEGLASEHYCHNTRLRSISYLSSLVVRSTVWPGGRGIDKMISGWLLALRFHDSFLRKP